MVSEQIRAIKNADHFCEKEHKTWLLNHKSDAEFEAIPNLKVLYDPIAMGKITDMVVKAFPLKPCEAREEFN